MMFPSLLLLQQNLRSLEYFVKAVHCVQEKRQLQAQAIATGKKDKSRLTGGEHSFPLLENESKTSTLKKDHTDFLLSCTILTKCTSLHFTVSSQLITGTVCSLGQEQLLAGHYYNMSTKINSILGHISHLFVKNSGYNFLVKGWSLHEQTTKTTTT